MAIVGNILTFPEKKKGEERCRDEILECKCTGSTGTTTLPFGLFF